MKKLAIPIIAGLAIGFAAAYIFVSGKKEDQFKRSLTASQNEWEAEKAKLLDELAAARNQPPRIQTVYKEIPASYTNTLSPAQILDKLIRIKPNEEETRNVAFRKIIYYFQSLVEAGEYALPTIRDFLLQNVDVDYSQFDVLASGERAPRNRSAFASRNLVRTDFLVPPSLRLGLLSVLKQIGGVEAEQILGSTLATSARGVEIAFLARILQDMRPDYYRDAAVAAARELLTNPPSMESPNRLDENSKAYLYQVLSMFNDTSFANVAQTLIVTPEGRVDRSALHYVNDVLKEQSVQALLAAYNDVRLTNRMERSQVLNAALAYTGPNQYANQMFSEMLTNAAIPSGMRAYTVQSLAGSQRIDPPSDPYVIKARIQFLDTLRGSVTEGRIIKAIDDTRKDLDNILLGRGPSGQTR